MSPLLKSQLERARADGRNMVCLLGDDFMSSALLRGKPIPWTDATEYVAVYGQLMALLKPDVAMFDVMAFFKAWLGENNSALAEMRGKKRVRFALKKLLGMEEPRELMREIVDGLLATLSQPLFLLLPPNAEFLNWANMQANHTEERQISDFDVDTVSVYFADYLRTFSGLDIAGAIIQLPEGDSVDVTTAELYSPIINVAKHYRWSAGAVASQPSGVELDQVPLDFFFSDTAANASLLGAEAWSEDFSPASSSMLFANVPAVLAPALAADCVARWQTQSA